MMTFLALAAATSLGSDTCIDHTAHPFNMPASRSREVEVLRNEPEGRSERARFPDGTTVIVSADYCSEPVYTLEMDAPADAQNIMRLRQVFGQLDRFVNCPVSDWTAFDAAMDAAGASLDAGEAYDNGGEAIDGDGINATYLSIAPSGDRIVATIRCERPQDVR